MSNLPEKTKTLLAEPSLEGLVYLLRHKELWPEGFRWNFNRLETCAVGLAFRYWHMGDPDVELTTSSFGIGWWRGLALFGLPSVSGFVFTTPEHIAKRIDRHLARQSR